MISTRETYLINHPILGPYVQLVYDTPKEAGHVRLPSESRFGWGMPTDPVTAEFVRSGVGKVVFEVGSGLGDTVVLPALEGGASLVFATNIKREGEVFAESSNLVTGAKAAGRRDALRMRVLDETWWDRDLLHKPSVSTVLAVDADTSVPEDGTVDLMIARHSAQFGDPDKFLRLLDLASAALMRGGSFTGINFTPYTGYMYGKDKGETLLKMVSGNEAFAAGEAQSPAGVTEDLRALIGQPMGEEAIPFLYFDQPTIIGLLRCWSRTRVARGLPQDLQLTANYYFSPPVIARVNKLFMMPELEELAEREGRVFVERENHAFVLTKIA